MSRTAYCLIRRDPVYRREAFTRGLAACGFNVATPDSFAPPNTCRAGDVMVIWNRYGIWHDAAVGFEKSGGTVVVAENAYLANDRADRRRYALALHAHNGRGECRPAGPERWDALKVELAPWRATGSHVLVCPNRPFGTPGGVMTADWAERTSRLLAKLTDRPVRIRLHPGNGPSKKPFAADLEDAWAVVIWSSSVGCEALIKGVPVFCLAPWWVAKSATIDDVSRINAPPPRDRLAAFQRLAWAQWHVEEIERGDAFQHLLH